MDVHNTLYPFSTTKKIPHFTAVVTKIQFFGSNSQIYYDNLHNRLYADFQSRVLLFKETLPWSLKKEAFSWCLMKPQAMTLFYVASEP